MYDSMIGVKQISPTYVVCLYDIYKIYINIYIYVSISIYIYIYYICTYMYT